MTSEDRILSELREISKRISFIEAKFAQLRPQDFQPTVEQEIAAAKSQGISIYQLLESKTKESRGRKS